MAAWCPRCDELRPSPGPGAEAARGRCPECGAELANLERPRPRGAGASGTEPADGAAAPVSLQPPRSRLRAALLVTALALSGLGYVAGHAGGPHAPSRSAAAATTTTTAPPPPSFGFRFRGREQQLAPPPEERRLGWRARSGQVTLTLESISRSSDPNDPGADANAVLVMRVDGLPAGEQLLGLQGLELFDAGGGVYATPPLNSIGRQRGVAANPEGGGAAPGRYLVALGPAPSVGTLASVRVGALIVSRPPSARVPLGPVPPGAAQSATLQALPQGSRDIREVPLELDPELGDSAATVELSAAFVSARRVVLVVTVEINANGTFAAERALVPFTIGLSAGGGELCSRTDVFSASQGANPSVTLDCPVSLTAPTQLSATIGSGTALVVVSRALAG